MNPFIKKLTHLGVAGCLAASLGAISTPVYAGHDVGLFEVEGNAIDNPAIAGEDWDKVFAGTDSAAVSTFIDRSTERGTGDVTYFTGGGSKDINDINQWLYTSGDTTPDKDDIQDAFAAAYTLGTETYLYFGLDRLAQNGAADVGFWFFRNPVSLVPFPAGTNQAGFNGVHKARDGTGGGDLLVVSEFTQGGVVSLIKVYEWVGSGGSDGPLDLIGSAAECNGASDEECAIANTIEIDSPWPYTPKSGTNNKIPKAGFFEGTINLSALLGGQVGCFSSFLAETRSSPEPSAQLKDMAFGEFQLCGLTVTKTSNVDQVCNSEGSQSVDYTFTVNNTGSAGLTVTLVDDNGTEDTADDIDVIGAFTGEDDAGGTAQLDTVIIAGGGQASYTIPISVSGVKHNTVTATGTAGTSVVTATDDHTVTVEACTLEITKTPDRTQVCSQNAGVEYDYLLTNTGSVAVTINSVSDDNGTPGAPGDDVNLLAQLDPADLPLVLEPNGSQAFSYSTTLTAAPGVTVTNTVNASGTAALLDFTVNAPAATANVLVQECSITVTKDCVNASGQGQPITYSGVITNTGNVAITGITLSDVNDEGTASVTPLATTLAPGGSTSYSGSYLPTQTTGNHTDTITVSGTATFEGGNSVSNTAVGDSDDATCIIETNPNITVTKECTNGGFPPADSPISFTGTVTNNGNVTLVNVTVKDDQVDAEDGAGDGTVLSGITLDPGESANYNGQYVPDFTWNKNTVTATGDDQINGGSDSDTASAVCQGCPFVDNPAATNDTAASAGDL